MNPHNSKADAAHDPTPGPSTGRATSASTARWGRWLARLSMSFAVVAVVLAWQGYQSLAGGAAFWRSGVELFASAAAATLAFAGVRERHRSRR